jgi:hypothetical protein
MFVHRTLIGSMMAHCAGKSLGLARAPGNKDQLNRKRFAQIEHAGRRRQGSGREENAKITYSKFPPIIYSYVFLTI